MTKTEQAVVREKLEPRSVIRINTDQAAMVTLQLVPGVRPYIHFCAEDLKEFDRLGGFIDDKDIPKLRRFANACAAHAKSKKG